MTRLLTGVPERYIRIYERELAISITRQAIESGDIDDENGLVTRPILPSVDLDSGDDNGWSGDAEWRQDWSANGSASDWNEAYRIESNNRAESKIIVIYGLTFLHTNVETRQVRHRDGIGGNGGTMQRTEVEGVEIDEESRGIFTHPLLHYPKENSTIDHWVSSATDGNRVKYDGIVCESVDRTANRPMTPFTQRRVLSTDEFCFGLPEDGGGNGESQ